MYEFRTLFEKLPDFRGREAKVWKIFGKIFGNSIFSRSCFEILLFDISQIEDTQKELEIEEEAKKAWIKNSIEIKV